MRGLLLNAAPTTGAWISTLGATAVAVTTTLLSPSAEAGNSVKDCEADCTLVNDWGLNLGDFNRYEDITQVFRATHGLAHPEDDVTQVDPRDLFDLSKGVPMVTLDMCYGKFFSGNETLVQQVKDLSAKAVSLNTDGNTGLSYEEAKKGLSPTEQAQVAALYGSYRLFASEELPEEGVVVKEIPPKATYDDEWRAQKLTSPEDNPQGDINQLNADKKGLRGQVGLGAFASLLLLLGGMPLAFLYGRQRAARKDWSFRTRLGLRLAGLRSSEKAEKKFKAAQKNYPDLKKEKLSDAKVVAGASDVAKIAAIAVIGGTLATAAIDIGTITYGVDNLMRTLEPLVP